MSLFPLSIDDPQRGEWLPDNPGAWIVSAHFPQMLSPTVSPGEIMWKFHNSTDKKNFHNRVLGKPWLDPSQLPVTLEHMARCVEEGKKAGLVWKTRARGAFMGIDQMGQHNGSCGSVRAPPRSSCSGKRPEFR